MQEGPYTEIEHYGLLNASHSPAVAPKQVEEWGKCSGISCYPLNLNLGL